MDFQALKSFLKNDFSDKKKVRLTLVSDSASQFLMIAIRGYGYHLGYDFEIQEVPYDQMDREFQDTSSDLYQFNPHFILIFHSSRKRIAKFYSLSDSGKSAFAEDEITQLEKYYEAIISSIPECHIIIANIPESGETVFGNFSNKITVSLEYQIRKYNYELMNLSQRHGNLHINDFCRLQAQLGMSRIFDSRLYITADMAFGLEAMPYLAKNTCDIINVLSGKVKKCLILDLDNTLWGGIIGDDGVENIEIGSLGIGKAFSELQSWIQQLKPRGIILAVCSQNDEEVAKKPFIEHPEMVLKLDDIALFVANWDSKVENIKYIQSILNIDFNSMVFLDDDTFQRNLVQTYLPEVTVPDLPKDPSEYISFLNKFNYFEASNYSREDGERGKYYKDEMDRVVFKKSFASESDYMASLEMTAEVLPFDAYTLPRVAQLIQRSNQFNLRTIRYSEEQLKELSRLDQTSCMAFSLKDRFGNYGVISVVILRHEELRCYIDSWLMSCRVLRRGMEHLALDCIVSAAIARGNQYLVGEYIQTSKNKLVENHYHTMGFKPIGGKWELDVAKYVRKPFFIKTIRQDQYDELDVACH